MKSFWSHIRVREIEGILVLLVAALVLLSLLSYSSSDPSLNSTGLAPGAPIHNRAGVFGSYLSDLLFQLFGLPSFLFPLFAVYVGIVLVLHRTLSRLFLRAVGALLLVCVASTVVALSLPQWTYQDLPSGGVFGYGFATLLRGRFSLQGGLLVCLAGTVIAALFMTPLPLPEIVKRLARAAGRLVANLKARIAKSWDTYEREKLRKEVIAKHAIPQPTPTQLPLEPPARPSQVSTQKIEQKQRKAAGDRPVQEELPFPEETRRREAAAKLPPLSLLDNPPQDNSVDEKELQAKAKLIESKCGEFGIEGYVSEMHPGPVITTYEYQPNAGVKFSRVQGMVDDLSLALKTESVLVTKVPGRSTVGIEVPNAKRERICLRDIIASQQFQKSTSNLTLALGKQTTGEPFVTDLARMPHLLIAGATGMGKSVSLNAMICSLLYKSSPEEVRLILVDPKRVELAIYADIPHLYCEVITEPKKAVTALKNAKLEMDKRYRTLVRFSARNLDQYNQKVRRRDFTVDPKEEKPQPLPYLVIVIDELADLMAEMSMEVEHQIGRLAQMARAVGIHLILATQRPSVDVITGTIKNNLPARISFRVSQKIDSRTILDASGAEQLLGNGDMLYLAPGTSRLVRIHGSYVSEEEIMRMVAHVKREGRPAYNHAFLKEPVAEGGGVSGEVQDELFRQAVELVLGSGQASASHLQRRLKLGYNRAARLIDLMEEQGIVGPASGPNKSREILVKPDFLETLAAGRGTPEE